MSVAEQPRLAETLPPDLTSSAESTALLETDIDPATDMEANRPPTDVYAYPPWRISPLEHSPWLFAMSWPPEETVVPRSLPLKSTQAEPPDWISVPVAVPPE